MVLWIGTIISNVLIFFTPYFTVFNYRGYLVSVIYKHQSWCCPKLQTYCADQLRVLKADMGLVFPSMQPTVRSYFA